MCIILTVCLIAGCGKKSPAYDLNKEGYQRYTSGDYEGALAKYNEAIEADKNYGTVYANRGMLYFYMGDIDKALADINQAIEENKEDPVAYSNRGYIKLATGKNQEAVDDLEKAVGLRNKFEDPQQLALTYVTLGSAYGLIGQYEEGAKAFDKAIDMNKNDKSFYNAKGILMKDWGKYEEAIEAYNKAISLDQSYAYAYGNRAFIFYIQKEYKKALADVNTAIDIDSSIPQVHNTKALILSAEGNHDEAIEVYSYALTRWPNYVDAYIGRGNEYLTIESYSQALPDFAVAADKGNLEARLQQGYLHARLEQYAQAITAFTKYLEVRPNDYMATVEVGNNHNQLGRYDEAIKYYDQAIKIDPEHYLAYYRKGLSLEYQEKYKEALEVINIALTKKDLEEIREEIKWIEKKLK